VRRRLTAAAGVAAALATAVSTASAGSMQLRANLDAYPLVHVTVVTRRVSATPPKLTENGRPVEETSAVDLGREKAVVLAVDRSRSMRGRKFADAVDALRRFVALKPAGDQIAVDAFGSQALQLTMLQQSTIDADTALHTLSIDDRSGTALYDEIVAAAHELRQPLTGRVLILLTDGADVGSVASLSDAIEAVRQAKAAVYPIALGSGAALGPLRSLAAASGGRLYLTATSATLTEVYRQIRDRLARTWLLSYASATLPGDSIDLALRSGGSARSRVRLVAPGVEPVTGTSGGGLGSVPVAVVALIGGILVAVSLLLLLRRPRSNRLRQIVIAHTHEGEQPKVSRRGQLLAGLFRATERSFGTLRFWQRISARLEQSAVPLRTVEFVYLAIGSSLAAGLVGAVAGLPTLVILLAALGGGGLPFAVVSVMARRRRTAFENQLPDLLAGLAAALRAGHSLKQGLSGVVAESAEPLRSEFSRALAEARLGRPLDQALDAVASRVGSDELDYVVTAIAVQSEAGGSLAQLFEMVAETVRQRHQHARRLRSLTAQGRMSAYVLVSLPFAVAALLTVINPSTTAPLFHDPLGQMLVVTSVVMIAIGAFFLRRIVTAAAR
jgi:tight adherence protein B